MYYVFNFFLANIVLQLKLKSSLRDTKNGFIV